MAYIVLPRKYRPQNFDEVVGQTHVTQTLKNAVQTGKIYHAYLFSGPRGIGKTSTARILAKCLNCEKGMTPNPCGKCTMCREITEGTSIDILEIDAASHTQVDKARDLIEKVKFTSGSARYKMYIIDEVHMLSDASFNALLKTIEEPPPNVVFVLATTAPHHVPQTILSRCQWFVFKRISTKDIMTHLRKLSNLEGIQISESSLYAIARYAEGSLRDAEVSLDQIVSFSGNEVKDEDVNALLGIIRADFFRNFFEGLFKADVPSVIGLINEIINSGYEIEDFIKGLQEYIRNLIVLKDGISEVTETNLSLVDLPEEDVKELKAKSNLFSEEELVWMLDVVYQTQRDLRQFGMRGQERLILELMAIRLAKRGFRISGKPGATEKKQQSPEIVQTQKIQGPPVLKDVLGTAQRVVETRTPSHLREKEPYGVPAHTKELDIGQILNRWNDVVERMKDKRMGIAHFLEEVKPVEIKDATISAVFTGDSSFHKERAEDKKNKELIEATLKEVYGKPLKIEFVWKENKSTGITEDGENLREDPVVKKMVELFKARVAETKWVQGGKI